MEHLAFTGTQQGMTPAQRQRYNQVFAELRPAWLHHGDCVGADAEAHDDSFSDTRIHIHPCNIPSKRAWKFHYHKREKELPPLERNRVMVDVSEALVATPKGMEEELRSGTWATVRYARKQQKPVHIVWPDGSYTGPLE